MCSCQLGPLALILLALAGSPHSSVASPPAPPSQTPPADEPPPSFQTPPPYEPPTEYDAPSPTEYDPPPPPSSEPPTYSEPPRPSSEPPTEYDAPPPTDDDPPTPSSESPTYNEPVPVADPPSSPLRSPSPSELPPLQEPVADKQLPVVYPPSSPLSPRSSRPMGVIIGAVIGSVVVVILLIVGLSTFFMWRKKRNGTQSTQSQAPESKGGPTSFPRVHSPKKFTYKELERATDGFSESNKLGRGGFGTVYKGVLPADNDNNTNNNSNNNDNNEMVAIKKLNAGSTQGIKEFIAEVEAISRVHHRHIVSLVGYFIDEQVEVAHLERPMMVVYEFIPNNSLDFHLYGPKTIDWKTRMKIAIVSAKGLAYLHEGCKPKIIHRDIKPSNILVDGDFQPKIADFGLAQLLSDTEIYVKNSLIIGTIGYLAPEYLEGGRISEKSDVFSFGVVLLELITGQKPLGSHPTGMVKWARPLLSEAMINRNFEPLADTKFRNDYEAEEMFRMVHCAANCIRHLPEDRPLMSQVVDALEGKIVLDNGGVGVIEHIEPSGSSHRNN